MVGLLYDLFEWSGPKLNDHVNNNSLPFTFLNLSSTRCKEIFLSFVQVSHSYLKNDMFRALLYAKAACYNLSFTRSVKVSHS